MHDTKASAKSGNHASLFFMRLCDISPLWCFTVNRAWRTICSVKAAMLVDLKKQTEDLDRATVTSDVLKRWTTFQLPVKLPHRLWKERRYSALFLLSASLINAFCVLNILFRLDSRRSESLTPVLACVSVRKNIFLSGFALNDQWSRKHTSETLVVLKTKLIVLLHRRITKTGLL